MPFTLRIWGVTPNFHSKRGKMWKLGLKALTLSVELNNSHLTGLEVLNDTYLFVWAGLYLNPPFKKAIFISFKMQQPKSPESRLFSMCEDMIHTKSLHHYLVTFKKHCLWLQAGLAGNILGCALRSESE